jgi:argininosuccinate lyase
VMGHRLKTTDRDCMKALDPTHFVEVRTIEGGPAPNQVRAAIARTRTALTSNHVWLTRKQHLLENYPKRIREAMTELCGSSS